MWYIVSSPRCQRCVLSRNLRRFKAVTWHYLWFYQDHASRRYAKLQKYINIWKVKPKAGEKKRNMSTNHLPTVYLKSSEKINCAISGIQWQTKIIKMWSNRTAVHVRWSRPTPDGGTIPSLQNLRAISFLWTVKSPHFWSVVRKVPEWSYEHDGAVNI